MAEKAKTIRVENEAAHPVAAAAVTITACGPTLRMVSEERVAEVVVRTAVEFMPLEVSFLF